MPYMNIKITKEGTAAEQKAAFIGGANPHCGNKLNCVYLSVEPTQPEG